MSLMKHQEKRKKEMLKHVLSNIYGLYLCMWLGYVKVNSTQVKKKTTTLYVTKIYITFADIYKTLDYSVSLSWRKNV